MAAMPDTQAPRGSGRGGDFWRWWRSEIVRLLPERFALLGGARSLPLLLLEGDDAVALDASASPAVEKRASLTGLDEPRRRAAVRGLLEQLGETRGRARAALRHDEALVRRVTLPAATEENLAQVLGFEMDRLSPFRADEVYFDQRVVSRDSANGNIGVELAVARRETVDARVRELRALGVSVQGVAMRDETRRSPDAFDLLPSEQRGERETSRERLVRNVLICAAALLFLAALVYPVYNKREAVKAMLPLVEKARKDAQDTNTVVTELERLAGDYNFLLARRHNWMPAAAYLEEISRLLPDNTWLQQMDIKTSGKTKELVLTGETASSSKLIEVLETSKAVQNAAPRGPTTRGSTPGSERFMIGAELRPRTAPEAQPITVAARPVAPPPPAPAPNAPAPPAANAGPSSVPAGANAVSAPSPSKPAGSSGFGPFPKK
jgi:general secretion pathway protein L